MRPQQSSSEAQHLILKLFLVLCLVLTVSCSGKDSTQFVGDFPDRSNEKIQHTTQEKQKSSPNQETSGKRSKSTDQAIAIKQTTTTIKNTKATTESTAKATTPQSTSTTAITTVATTVEATPQASTAASTPVPTTTKATTAASTPVTTTTKATTAAPTPLPTTTKATTAVPTPTPTTKATTVATTATPTPVPTTHATTAAPIQAFVGNGNGQANSDGYPKTYVVYTTKTGEKYHKDWCRSLKRSKFETTLGAAESRGYKACKICFR